MTNIILTNKHPDFILGYRLVEHNLDFYPNPNNAELYVLALTIENDPFCSLETTEGARAGFEAVTKMSPEQCIKQYLENKLKCINEGNS